MKKLESLLGRENLLFFNEITLVILVVILLKFLKVLMNLAVREDDVRHSFLFLKPDT